MDDEQQKEYHCRIRREAIEAARFFESDTSVESQSRAYTLRDVAIHFPDKTAPLIGSLLQIIKSLHLESLSLKAELRQMESRAAALCETGISLGSDDDDSEGD